MNSRKPRDPQGWNAGLFKALEFPDGPFKLYVWLRLNARMDGSLETSQSDISRALNKARGTIRANLQTLEQAGVCRMKFPRDPQGRGWLQITDDYWPYERIGNSEADDPQLRSYLDQVRRILAERACVRTPLSTADELLAREWHEQGIAIEHVGQAVLMGCGRKYVSWRNGAPRTQIGSLAYFQPILAEVKEEKVSAEYWEYTRHRIERMEKLWISGKDPQRFEQPKAGA